MNLFAKIFPIAFIVCASCSSRVPLDDIDANESTNVERLTFKSTRAGGVNNNIDKEIVPSFYDLKKIFATTGQNSYTIEQLNKKTKGGDTFFNGIAKNASSAYPNDQKTLTFFGSNLILDSDGKFYGTKGKTYDLKNIYPPFVDPNDKAFSFDETYGEVNVDSKFTKRSYETYKDARVDYLKYALQSESAYTVFSDASNALETANKKNTDIRMNKQVAIQFYKLKTMDQSSLGNEKQFVLPVYGYANVMKTPDKHTIQGQEYIKGTNLQSFPSIVPLRSPLAKFRFTLTNDLSKIIRGMSIVDIPRYFYMFDMPSSPDDSTYNAPAFKGNESTVECSVAEQQFQIWFWELQTIPPESVSPYENEGTKDNSWKFELYDAWKDRSYGVFPQPYRNTFYLPPYKGYYAPRFYIRQYNGRHTWDNYDTSCMLLKHDGKDLKVPLYLTYPDLDHSISWSNNKEDAYVKQGIKRYYSEILPGHSYLVSIYIGHSYIEPPITYPSIKVRVIDVTNNWEEKYGAYMPFN